MYTSSLFRPFMLTLVGAIGIASSAAAQTRVDLSQFSIEDLLQVNVVSASKKEQKLFRTPAAIAVLTNEEIRRAGVTSIPDALRLVPGVQVASIDGNRWAVSARGFNSLYANKLLVLIDGRSVYNPTYSGVFWDTQDVALEDIDRIEVIRGPGAALWGANAVNGVINIITKSARTTHGTTVTASAGSIDRGSISARYGGQFGEHTDYRVSTKFTNRGRTRDNGYGNPADDWRTGHVQARLDSTLSARDTVTIGGGVGAGEIGQSRLMVNGVMPWEQATITTPVEASQFNAMTRWTRTLSSGGDVVVDGSIDRVNRYETIIGAQITVATIDVQHHVRRGAHDLIVGAGQRVTFDRELTTLAFSMPRDRERIGLTNVFVQDEIALVPGLLAATLGSKMEYSTVSGGNFQPNARIAVTPNAHHTFWASAARAVRTPSRNERFMTYRYLNIATPELPMALAIAGNDALEPETLHAFEVGYRMQPVQWAHVDATAFVNRYLDVVRFQNVTSIETSPPPVHILDSLQYVNAGTASTRGVELSVDVRPLPQWQVTTGFSMLHARSAGDSSPALLAFPANAYSPTHQWFVASRASLGRDIEADATLFRVGDLPATPVPAYSRVDARLGWTRRHIDVSLVGQNLLEADHVEFDRIEGQFGSRIPRSLSMRLTLAF